MATAKQVTFTHKELAELMVRDLGIAEGLWGIYVRFGLQARNIGSSETDLQPAAIVPIVEIGVQKFDKPTNLTVDAAELQTRKAAKRKSVTKSTKKGAKKKSAK